MPFAASPDDIAQAFIDFLSPGGVPVGGIGSLVKRTPDAEYDGPTPIVMVKPIQNTNQVIAGASTGGGAYVDQGWMELTYRDASLAQQQTVTPGVTLSQIEDAMVAARNAIVAQFRTSGKLNGAVSSAGFTIEETYQPDGYYVVWQAAEWYGWTMRVSYRGVKRP